MLKYSSVMSAPRRALSREITEAFYGRALDLSDRPDHLQQGWDAMPEVKAAKHLENAGRTPEQIRLFLTFTSAMDRSRDADRLWRRAAKLCLTTPWIFDPARLVEHPRQEIAAILRESRVSQKHRMDAYAWCAIAKNLSQPERAPLIHRAVYGGQGDARELLRAVEACDEAGRTMFPLLRGRKIAPMWVRILIVPGGATLSNIDAIPVAVDVQVRKVSQYLGLSETERMSIEIIQKFWREQVQQFGAIGPEPLQGTCAAIDPALWFFAKHGCSYCEKVRKKVPISAACEECTLPVRLVDTQNRPVRCPPSARRTPRLSRQ